MDANILPEHGLTVDQIAAAIQALNVPVLFGVPTDLNKFADGTLFIFLTKSHWFVCVKGPIYSKVWDPIGLPDDVKRQLIPFEFRTWGYYGYQYIYSNVCGYYCYHVAKKLAGWGTDIDELFSFLPYSLPTPPTFDELLLLEETFKTNLLLNDNKMYEFAKMTYPELWQVTYQPAYQPFRDNVIQGSAEYNSVPKADTVQRYDDYDDNNNNNNNNNNVMDDTARLIDDLRQGVIILLEGTADSYKAFLAIGPDMGVKLVDIMPNSLASVTMRYLPNDYVIKMVKYSRDPIRLSQLYHKKERANPPVKDISFAQTLYAMQQFALYSKSARKANDYLMQWGGGSRPDKTSRGVQAMLSAAPPPMAPGDYPNGPLPPLPLQRSYVPPPSANRAPPPVTPSADRIEPVSVPVVDIPLEQPPAQNDISSSEDEFEDTHEEPPPPIAVDELIDALGPERVQEIVAAPDAVEALHGAIESVIGSPENIINAIVPPEQLRSILTQPDGEQQLIDIIHSIPIPPPPPPPLELLLPTPPPPPPGLPPTIGAPAPVASKNALLAAITRGTTLKKTAGVRDRSGPIVEKNETDAPPPPPPSMDAHLAAIMGGRKTLRKANILSDRSAPRVGGEPAVVGDKRPAASGSKPGNAFNAEMMAKLNKRRAALAASDDEDDVKNSPTAIGHFLSKIVKEGKKIDPDDIPVADASEIADEEWNDASESLPPSTKRQTYTTTSLTPPTKYNQVAEYLSDILNASDANHMTLVNQISKIYNAASPSMRTAFKEYIPLSNLHNPIKVVLMDLFKNKNSK